VSLRIAAISFLNPAPLLYNFEHEPAASELRSRYAVHYTSPADCARELHAGAADLGLIPIAELTPNLAIVPECAIASLGEVRSILLLVRNPGHLPMDAALERVRTVATDAASRSSVAYTRILLEHFHNAQPSYFEHMADPLTMLALADAALLIGDPALLARERRAQIDAAIDEPLLWLDLAELWQERTGLPWVAAVWALRPEALEDPSAPSSGELIADLTASRDAGLSHIEAIVGEWIPRLPLSAEAIRSYLTNNIHYRLDDDCLRAIALFRELAAKINALPPLPELRLLRP
jgi:chorismate dehydratase